MANPATDIGRAALAAALARAGRRASAAAAVAAIVPLALAVATPPAEATLSSYSVTGGTPTSEFGHFNYAYTFSSTLSAAPVHEIEIPEIMAGEFLLGADGQLIPSGWSVSQTTAALGTGAAFKAPNTSVQPAAYIELLWGGTTNELGSGSIQTFDLESATSSTIASNAFVAPTGEGLVTTVDPPTPNPAPEPGTLALIGTALAGLVGPRRRRRG